LPPVILDKRSFAARLAGRLWARWQEHPGAGVSSLARMTAACTDRLVTRRVAARGVPRPAPFILSVGNLVVGGTGKTPVVLALGRELARRGWQGAILGRGYGSPLKAPLVVNPDNEQAADEMRFLAAGLPRWTVIQARRRRDGLPLVRARQPAVQIVVLEDGHQTAGVPRHLDVVILDRWTCEAERVVPELGLVFPWGPFREGTAGAARAGIWLVPASDGLPAEGTVSPAGAAVPVVPFARRLSLPAGWRRERLSGLGVLSGIANPDRFEADCADLVGRPPALVARFDDHHRYRAAEVRWLQRAGSQAGVTGWLTTEKDWIKLRRFWPSEVPIFPVRLDIDWPGKETLPDLIEERLRQNPG